ncbi:ECF transporter S component [Brochothrix campestris]|nr:ECF transporter S component [Brochothrix campestris]
MQNRRNKTLRLALLGVLTAIIIIQTFVPFLGYIPLGVLNVTIIPVTIIIAAVVLGPKDGAIVGGVWGMIVFIRAYVAPTSPLAPLVFVNPIISVLPRILIGLLAGYAYMAFTKLKLNQSLSLAISAIIGSAVNTILVLGLIFIFYKEVYADFIKLDVDQVLGALMVIISTNGVLEAVFAAIVVPIIARPLLARWKK